jgi:hypothetical protein
VLGLESGCQRWLGVLHRWFGDGMWRSKLPRPPPTSSMMFQVGNSAAQGMRNYMEDTYVVQLHVFPEQVTFPFLSLCAGTDDLLASAPCRCER